MVLEQLGIQCAKANLDTDLTPFKGSLETAHDRKMRRDRTPRR